MKVNHRSRDTLTAVATLIIHGNSITQVIEKSLYPDNKINPPAMIKSELKGDKLHYHLNAFEKADSLLRAVNDILGAAQLVEKILQTLDEN